MNPGIFSVNLLKKQAAVIALHEALNIFDVCNIALDLLLIFFPEGSSQTLSQVFRRLFDPFFQFFIVSHHTGSSSTPRLPQGP